MPAFTPSLAKIRSAIDAAFEGVALSGAGLSGAALPGAGAAEPDMPHRLALLRTLAAVTEGVGAAPDSMPPGRYLLRAEARYNVQLDVFTAGYTGGVHAHGAWGAFIVLTGALWSEDWDSDGGIFRPTRTAILGPGSGQAFGPPTADWHRVGTPATGPRTTSLHVYGAGFDMDTGLRLGDDGRPCSYTRGALGDLRALQGFVDEVTG